MIFTVCQRTKKTRAKRLGGMNLQQLFLLVKVYAIKHVCWTSSFQLHREWQCFLFSYCKTVRTIRHSYSPFLAFKAYCPASSRKKTLEVSGRTELVFPISKDEALMTLGGSPMEIHDYFCRKSMSENLWSVLWSEGQVLKNMTSKNIIKNNKFRKLPNTKLLKYLTEEIPNFIYVEYDTLKAIKPTPAISEQNTDSDTTLMKMNSYLRCSYFHTPSSWPSGGSRILSMLEQSALMFCWMYWGGGGEETKTRSCCHYSKTIYLGHY